jgi:DNA-binding IclR family transcriptional regulator
VHAAAQPGAQLDALGAIHARRRAQKAALLDQLLHIYAQDPRTGATDAARALGIHRNTVYNYLAELENDGRIRRTDGAIHILDPVTASQATPVAAKQS